MKHAILIIAYHNFAFVKRQIEYYDEDFYIFIHWDKRQTLSSDEKAYLSGKKNVLYWGQEYIVNWGSFAIVKATLYLCEKAIVYKNISYFHLISDADIIVQDLNSFKKFFNANKGKNYLEYFSFGELNYKSESYKKIIYYHRLEKFNIRVIPEDNERYNNEIHLQIKNKEYRRLPKKPIYGGSAWWSLDRKCIQELIKKKNFIYEYYTDTIFPDESFAQTILLNSTLDKTIVNDNLRYICWEYRNNSNPAILDRNDLPIIMQSQKMFARKVDPIISMGLIQSIENIYYKSALSFSNTADSVESMFFYLRENSINYDNGFLYGNFGRCLLFCYCYKMAGNSIISESEFMNSLVSVLEEFITTSDGSFETGKPGLAIGIEHLFHLVNKHIPSHIISELDDMNEQIINYALNMSDKIIKNATELSFLLIYFHAREKNHRLTVQDNSIRNYLISKMNNNLLSKTIMEHQWNSSIGLSGIAGKTLYLISKKREWDIEDWYYLVNYKINV